MGDDTAGVSWERLSARVAAAGLSVRGAFDPRAGELDAAVGPAARVGTCVLVGFTGGLQWPQFVRSAEARDGRPDPLDRWSRRLIDEIAAEQGAVALYPSGTPVVPFQQLALRSESVHRSPLGLLIHPRWGLWHAYRGALLLPVRIPHPHPAPAASPCDACVSRPCLAACPVNAFREGGYDVVSCRAHVESVAGGECRDRGCLARRACPVAAEYRYEPAQARFHMAAFLAAGRSAVGGRAPGR